MTPECDLPVEAMAAVNSGVPAVFVLLTPPYAMNGGSPQAREMSPAQARTLAEEIKRAADRAEQAAREVKLRMPHCGPEV